MHRRAAILLIACFTIASFAYWSFEFLQFEGKTADTESKRSPAQIRPLSSASGQPIQAAEGASSEGEEKTDAIENQRIFTFASEEELDAFLSALDENGIDVAAISRTLRSAKLDGDKSVFDKAKELAGKQAQVDSNFTVLIPFPVAPEADFSGVPFEANALPFIGVPDSNSDWGAGVTIAILDTGILPHETLEGVSIKTIDLVDENQSNYASHGTAVASLIAGQSGNGIAPSVDLLNIRVLDSDGIGDAFTLARGIVEAVDAGAQIINMSLGGFGDNVVMQNAIDYANSKGVAMIAATGNEGLNVLPYPAQYDNVIAVSAIDASNKHASFSNQAQTVDVAAPGVGIYAAWETDQWVSISGTSASAPFVSGAIAAIVSQRPGTSPIEAATILLQNANDSGFPGIDPQTGRGIIDLERSLYPVDAKITDLALADIHLDRSSIQDNGAKVYVTAQNRGTEKIDTANLRIAIDGGVSHTTYLGTLLPGEVKTHELIIPLHSIAIEAEAVIPYGTPDSRNSNDQLHIVIENAP